jgi:hypothetical protein
VRFYSGGMARKIKDKDNIIFIESTAVPMFTSVEISLVNGVVLEFTTVLLLSIFYL